VKICVCFNVSDRLVRERARMGVPLEAVLKETGAGSACGKCRFAIGRLYAGEVLVAPPCAERAAARDAA
jgi:bacterioferritin-associated ferredoxin